MKQFLVFTIALITLEGISQSQFSRFFGEPSSNMRIEEMIETYDGGFLSLVKGSKATLIKFDETGDTLWTKYVGATNSIKGISETDDHNILLSGSTLSKLDEFGNEIWTKEFSGPLNGGALNSNSVVASTATGGVLVSSESYQYFSGAFIYEAALCVYGFDDNGDIVWTKHLSGAYFNGINIGVSVTPQGVYVDASGNIYAFGIRSNSSDYSIIIWKLDGSGNTQWLKEYVTSNTESFDDGDLMANGNILLSGFGFGSGLGGKVIQMDPNGDIVWSKIITVPNSGRAVGIVELHNSDLAISVENLTIGSLSYQNGVYLTDDTLGLKKTILHGGESSQSGGKIVQLNDLSIVNATPTNAFSFQSRINFQQFDTLGNTTGCYEAVTFPTVIDNPISFTDLVMNEIQGGSNFSSTLPTSFYSIQEFDYGFDITGVVQPGDCQGDQGLIDISMDGTAPYTFSWSNGTSAEDLVDFGGIYDVTVVDADGCIRKDTFELTEPTAINVTYSTTNVDCFGAGNGSIDLSVSGGTPGYTYQWSTLATNEDLSNLSGGFYQCIIEDTKGCSKMVGVSVSEPQQLTAVILSTINASCADSCNGELAGFAAGGVAPYSYLWNDAMTQTNDTAIGLCNGNYLLKVTDDHGCISYANAFISEPSPLVSQIATYPSECLASNGSAEAYVSGGSGPYTYNWNNSGAVSNDSIGGFGVGNYSLEVVDANGCSVEQSFMVSSNTPSVEICVITVDSNNQNLLVWEKPVVSNIAGFNIYRNIAGVYTQIGYQPYDSISQFIDNDFGVDPQITSYRYKISVLDSCGNESALSSFHETIHLTANLGVGGDVNLIWDDYEGFSFSEYEIWRDTTGHGDWETIGNTLSTSFTFTDQNVPQNAVSLRYAIEVVLPNTCTSSRSQNYGSTRSNKQTVMGPGAELASGIETQILADAMIFPNPMSDQVTIRLNATNWTYRVMDVSGRLVTSGNSNQNQLVLNVSDFETGVYLVEVELNGHFQTKKLLKQ